MKNNFKKALMALLPLSAVAVTAPLVVTSCSTANNKVEVVKFNATGKIGAVTKAGGLPVRLALDPNVNTDAWYEAIKTFQEVLDKDKLQADFDKVLTKFFKAYEYEIEKPAKRDSGLEADIEQITVKSFDKKTLTAKLDVKYEVEEAGKERFETQTKYFVVTPMFATKPQIKQTTDLLKRASDEHTAQPGVTIDVEDLRELYVGDKSDREPSIFEQINAFTEENAQYGGLLGYELNLMFLNYTPQPGARIAESRALRFDKFFAPSNEIKKYFVPDMQEYKLPSGLDLTMSYDKIRTKTLDDLMKSTNPKQTLLDLLANPDQALFNDLVSSVLITNPQPSIAVPADNVEITVSLKEKGQDATAMPMIVVLSISKNWLKPSIAAPITNL